MGQPDDLDNIFLLQFPKLAQGQDTLCQGISIIQTFAGNLIQLKETISQTFVIFVLILKVIHANF